MKPTEKHFAAAENNSVGRLAEPGVLALFGLRFGSVQMVRCKLVEFVPAHMELERGPPVERSVERIQNFVAAPVLRVEFRANSIATAK